MSQQVEVAIVGAGSSGLCAAIKLKEAGINNFVILEKGNGLGGTWYWNQYPGAECDVQSHLYSFSFEQNPNWSQPFAGQREILDYLEHCAEKYDLLKHIRFEKTVTDCVWSETESRWSITQSDGDKISAKIFISALGMFNNIVWPKIEGIETFQGDSFHSARWKKNVNLKDKRIGVVGIAASAVQFVPEIVDQAQKLFLYQRTANWVVPKPNNPYTKDELEQFSAQHALLLKSRDDVFKEWDSLCTFRDKKILAEIEKSGLERIAEVENPDIRRKLTPNHPFGCKRPLFSDKYYPVFNRNDVDLITSPISKISKKGIETADGFEDLDVIIFSTGFETTTYLNAINVTGRGNVNLKDAWDDGAQAYLGVTTTGFPNLFMLYGPNTNQGCILYMIERQVEYITRQIKRMQEENLKWIDLEPNIMKDFNKDIQKDIKHVDVWQADCGNDFYYRAGKSRRLVTQWPNSMTAYKHAIRKSDAGIYSSG
ncbi:MAG: NAD(P)/FAD-dependent oxidoreductase [Pseudomonadota bacterium]|nr:NAD(P)/FAD-dependent oxidoreductase [Pseudomonadota bacterium]